MVVALFLHDMGWAKDKSLLSKDKRFEIDGANIARDFVHSHADQGKWDKHRVQLLWDTIALHTTPSIAQHKEPEVLGSHLGILSDFLGVNLPLPGGPYFTVEEYKEIVRTFPRLGFKDEIRGIFCNMCRDKPDVTYDNFVGEYGRIYGLDGKGGGREDFVKQCEEKSFVKLLEGALDALVQYEN